MKRRMMMCAGLIAVLSVAAAGHAADASKNLWPLFHYESAEGVTQLEILWPSLIVEESQDRTAYRFLVVNAYEHDKKLDRTTWEVVWPIGKVEYGDERFAARLFPVFFGKTKTRSYFVVFPELWWNLKDDGSYDIVLLPWGRSHDADGDYFNALTPVFWGRNSRNFHGAILPISFWRFDHDGDEYRFFFFPYYKRYEGPRDQTTALLPWWITQDEDHQFANLVPVLWTKEGEETKELFVLPLVYYSAGGEDNILPFTEDKILVIFPLYAGGELGTWKWQAVLPPTYIHYANDQYEEYDVLWPLIQWGDGERITKRYFYPLYSYKHAGDYVRHGVLLDAIAYGRGGGHELTRVFPLYNFEEKGDRSQLMVLWPLYHEKADTDKIDRRVATLLPLGMYDLRQPSKAWSFFNIAWWASGSNGDRHGLFPLYTYRERDDETRFCLLDPWTPFDTRYQEFEDLPLLTDLLYLFKFTTEGGSQGKKVWQMPLMLFHYRKYNGTGTELTVGTPFVFNFQRSDGKDGPDREYHIATVFWDNKRSGGYRSQGLWPLYSYKKTEEGGLNASVLDPLWFWGEATGEEEHVSAFMKIFDYRKQPNGDSRFSILWRAYRREVRSESVTAEMLPFLSWKKSPGGKSLSFLWPIFQYERKGEDRSIRLFLSPKIAF
jgi:hypothetical protein